MLRICVAVVLLALLAGCESETTDVAPTVASPPTLPANAAANWGPLVSVDGVEHHPFSDANVKAVALIFVLSDCPIANSYAPEFSRLHAEFSSRGVAMLLIHADPTLTPAAANEHAKEYRLDCPVVVDPQQTWVRRAGATATPEAVVFSPAGELLYRGRIDDRYAGLGKRRTEVASRDLRDALEAVLAGKPVPQPRTEAIGCPIPTLSPGK
ncbi:MAG: redoxin domain-containing protein [Planctomycetes bacterium]|nr:redoxin domain-containing protein [Planctomycetota bacterium]